MIQVRIAQPDGNQVALWERHPAHPDGEVFLVGPGTFDVAETPAVEARLRNGLLVKVEAATVPDPAAKAEKAKPEAADVEPGKAESAPPARQKKPAPARNKGGL